MPGADTGTARPGLACLVPLPDRARDTGCGPGPILRWRHGLRMPAVLADNAAQAVGAQRSLHETAFREAPRGSRLGLRWPGSAANPAAHPGACTVPHGFFAKAATRRRPAGRAVSVAEPVRTEGARVVVAMVDWPAGSIAGPAPRPELKPTPAGFRPTPETIAGI